MHTDEYEISLAREINHHQQVVKKLKKNLAQRKNRHGMEYAEAALAVKEGRLILEGKELAQWQEDVEALSVWEQRLKEYREALAVMRISASRF